MPACPSETELERFQAGELETAVAVRVREHLATCETCSRKLAAHEQSQQALLNDLRQIDPASLAEDGARVDDGARESGGERRTRPIGEISPDGPALDAGEPSRPIPTIEGYEIIRELHRGGQGIVYQAIQKHTKRKVAIKVLLEGPYASAMAKRRFEREIELVAQLKHPNIISIFHSGLTSDGRQYCVMDYVRGRRLEEHVREKKLSLEETLTLFQTICEAVMYAHQRGIIHRDLKPSNIVVDSEGSPKVLDFGMAKQLVTSAETLASMSGEVFGTLQYMSPEQTSGNPEEVDTRTDIYALGVILYHLLTGCFPYPVEGLITEVITHIAQTSPTPLTRSWRRESGITTRTKQLRAGECPIDDEVETIVMKALAKERERRYQSAAELGRDVGHYLVDEPIEAKRDSRWYVLKKAIRRYKAPFAMAAVFVLFAVGAAVALSVMYSNQSSLLVQVEAREREATEARDQLQTVVTFQSSMLSEIDAEEMGRGIIAGLRDGIRESLDAASSKSEEVTATLASLDASVKRINPTNLALSVVDRYVLSRAVKTIERDFADQPLVEAALQRTIGSTYAELGMYSGAVPRIERALALHRRELGDDHPKTLMTMNDLGALLKVMGKLAEAEPYLRKALEGFRNVLGDDHPDTLLSINNIGGLLRAQGKLDEAVPYFREALEGKRRVLGSDAPSTLTAVNDIGYLLTLMGKLAEAEGYAREAVEGKRRVLGNDDPSTLTSIANMAGLLIAMGKLEEAESFSREALEGRRRVLGDDHPDTLTSMNDMGLLLKSAGKLAEAEDFLRGAVEGYRRVLGDDHSSTLISVYNLDGLLRTQGKLDEAEELGEEAVGRSREAMPTGHWLTAVFLADHARTLVAMERFAEAEPEMLEAHGMFVAALGAEQERTVKTGQALVDLYDTWHAAEPAKGFDAKAAQWRKKLPVTSQPASAPADAP